jgi:flagellar motor switch protein FliG
LAKALKSADKNILRAVQKNVSKRHAYMLFEDMENMGPVRFEDTNEAKSQIGDMIRHLEDFGVITVPKFSQREK